MTLISKAQDSLLDDDQRMLVDAARKWIERRYSTEQRKAIRASAEGFSGECWAEMAEMGWLGLGLPEEAGGFGGVQEAALVAEQLGRALTLEPWLGCIALAAPVLAASSAPAASSLLARVTQGEERVALAAFERQGRHDAFDVRTQALATPQGFVLQGHKTLVLGGAQAGQLIVLARLTGGARERAGLGLFLVPASATGLQQRSLPSYDGRLLSELVLQDVAVPASARIDQDDQAWSWVEAALDRAIVMQCAECVGAMDRLIDITRDYTLQRKQFGRSVASNQVVQHRLVDLWVTAQQLRSVTDAALDALQGDAATRSRMVSVAKAFLCNQGRLVGEDGVQLHGAIGMTDDYVVGHYYKRLAASVNFLGDENWHLERLDALEGLKAA